MQGIQILILAFSLFAIMRAMHQFRAGRLTPAWLIFWIIFWLGAGIVVVLPRTTDFLAGIVGVGRGADLVIYVSLIGLFYLVFRLFVRIEQLEREITLLVRKLSLDEKKSKK